MTTTASTFDSTLASLGIGRTGTAAAAATATTKSSTALDQSDFLTLMTAQLKNQDPFAPVDNTAMVAQMAQFSNVAGIAQMNTTLTGLATKLGSPSATDATAYVGKTVLTEGKTAYARTAGGIAGAVELGADASDVNVTISDANGSVLKTVALGAQSKGTVSYDWDGTNDAGTSAGDGPYTVTVAATNNGASVASTGLVWAPVESVALTSGADPKLTVSGIGSVAISAIRSVA